MRYQRDFSLHLGKKRQTRWLRFRRDGNGLAAAGVLSDHVAARRSDRPAHGSARDLPAQRRKTDASAQSASWWPGRSVAPAGRRHVHRVRQTGRVDPNAADFGAAVRFLRSTARDFSLTLKDGAPEAICRSNSSTDCSLLSMPWVMSVTGCTRRKMYSTATVIARTDYHRTAQPQRILGALLNREIGFIPQRYAPARVNPKPTAVK